MLTAGRLASAVLVAGVAACSSSSSGTATGGAGAATTATTGSGGAAGTGGSGGAAGFGGTPPGCQEYVLGGGADVRVSGMIAPASPAGLVWTGTRYDALYTGTSNGFTGYLSMLGADGAPIAPPGEQPFSPPGADASGGPIVAAGDRWGAVWQDRRTGDYEIFVALLGGDGAKIGQDLRVTTADGFSINPAIAW